MYCRFRSTLAQGSSRLIATEHGVTCNGAFVFLPTGTETKFGMNESIEENFYSKLKRARSQRDQYLAIQALTLADDHPRTSLRLLDEYFVSRKDEFDDVRALLAKA